MNLNSIAILVIIAISLMVFGGIIFFGLRDNNTAPTAPSPDVLGTVSRIPDTLDFSAPGNDLNASPPNQNSDDRGSNGQDSSKIINQDGVVERTEAPQPVFLSAPRSPQSQSKNQTQTNPAPSGSVLIPVVPLLQESLSTAQFLLSPRERAQAVAVFSVFDVSPRLRTIRTAMVADGAIKETEFVKINNKTDMQAFVAKMVEWRKTKPPATAEEIQNVQDRIIDAYNHLQTLKQ